MCLRKNIRLSEYRYKLQIQESKYGESQIEQ